MIVPCVFGFFHYLFHSKSYFVGKTTIADALVASNGIISQRMAGKVRAFFMFSVARRQHLSFILVIHVKLSFLERQEIKDYIKKREEQIKIKKTAKFELTKLRLNEL